MAVTVLGLSHPPVCPTRPVRPQVDYIALLKRQPQPVCLLAIAQLTTIAAAVRFHWAEREGHKRPQVLRTVERRIAELGGEEAVQRPQLVFAAEVLEPGEVAWRKAHHGKK